MTSEKEELVRLKWLVKYENKVCISWISIFLSQWLNISVINSVAEVDKVEHEKATILLKSRLWNICMFTKKYCNVSSVLFRSMNLNSTTRNILKVNYEMSCVFFIQNNKILRSFRRVSNWHISNVSSNAEVSTLYIFTTFFWIAKINSLKYMYEDEERFYRKWKLKLELKKNRRVTNTNKIFFSHIDCFALETFSHRTLNLFVWNENRAPIQQQNTLVL